MAKKSQCGKCTGLCCRYFALPIDKPKTREDFDDIRWYLCHERVSIFVEDGMWYISMKNECRHLTDTHQCAIYARRPVVCRGYKKEDCDYVEGEYCYDLHFTNDKEMDEYINIKFDNNVTEKQRLKKDVKKNKKAS
jgi:Fe-S-cluster containining protein